MNSDDFLNEYVIESIKSGYCSPKEICDRALNELNDIDKKIRETNILRIKSKNLKQVLKNFGHDSANKRKNVSEFLLESNLNDLYNTTVINICEFVEYKCKPVTSREILDNVGNREQHQQTYMAIKWLCDSGILSRNSDRSFIPGENWDKRVQQDIQNVS